MLRWTAFSIKGCRYLPDMDVPGATVLRIRGKNGAGKSLFLKQVRSIFERAHDPDLIREGAGKMQIEMQLSDGMKLRRVVTPKDSTATVRYEDGRQETKKIETFLKEITSGFSLDPFELIGADRAKRSAYLRKIFPVTFASQEVGLVLGRGTGTERTLTLEELDQFLAASEEDRTRAGARLTTIEETLRGLDAIVPDSDRDWWKESQEVQAKLNGVMNEFNSIRNACDTALELAVAEKKSALNKAIEDLRTRFNEDVAAMDVERHWEIEKKRQELQPSIDSLNIELGTALQKAQEQKRAEGVVQARNQQRDQLRDAARDRTRKQEIVEDLRKLRSAKLKEAIPVQGLDFGEDGRLFVNGKDFDEEINTGRQMELALQIASFGDSRLPLIITDRAESWDKDALKWAIEAITEAGFQMIMTEVDECPLTVEVVA